MKMIQKCNEKKYNVRNSKQIRFDIVNVFNIGDVQEMKLRRKLDIDDRDF